MELIAILAFLYAIGYDNEFLRPFISFIFFALGILGVQKISHERFYDRRTNFFGFLCWVAVTFSGIVLLNGNRPYMVMNLIVVSIIVGFYYYALSELETRDLDSVTFS